MKKLLAILPLLLVAGIIAPAQSLVQLWKTDSVLRVPESVLWDAGAKVLYVANIDGQPDGKDGVGSIGKIGSDGKILNAAWVTGLNAPKGMGLVRNTLYVADIDQVVVIDISSGKVTARIPIEGAKFLNDITIDPKEAVYVSDTGTNKIWKIVGNKPQLYFESPQFKGINGLLFRHNALYIVDFESGATYVLSEKKELQKIGETANGADGIVSVGKNEFIVSSWHGEIYHVAPAGKATLMIDTKKHKLNSADIWYDEPSATLYVPTFYANSVIAYKFKH